LLKSR
jgi:hypothetical protein